LSLCQCASIVRLILDCGSLFPPLKFSSHTVSLTYKRLCSYRESAMHLGRSLGLDPSPCVGTTWTQIWTRTPTVTWIRIQIRTRIPTPNWNLDLISNLDIDTDLDHDLDPDTLTLTSTQITVHDLNPDLDTLTVTVIRMP